MMYFLLIAGFVLLIKGADFFVDGSSAAAKKLRVPPLIIGMTIVSMGTSLPETSVSVSAALADKNELAVGNAVGSNIFNLMVVCGICALLCPMKISTETLKRDFPISIGAAAVLLGLGAWGMSVGHLDGAAMLVLFAAFLFLMILSARKSRDNAGEDEDYKEMPVWQLLLFIIGGIAAIAAGGKMVVEGASDIARTFGMSDNLIGMTVVALGTSLPELVTSIVAARKNEVDMALGNVVGSNIFNIFFVLGIASAISPIAFSMENIIDTAVLIGMSLLVLLFALFGKKLVRWHGAVMVILYAGYTGYIFWRSGVFN